jgi:hypothetical protein
MPIVPERQVTQLQGLPGPARRANIAIANIGPAITRTGERIAESLSPIIQSRVLANAREAAGAVTLERNSDGNLILPEASDGGLLYAAAYDELVQTRYMVGLGQDFQMYLDEEVNARMRGDDPDRPFDYDSFNAAVTGRMEGILEGVDPRVRGTVEQMFGQEITERRRSFGNTVSRAAREAEIRGNDQQISFLMNRYQNHRELDLSEEQLDGLEGSILELLGAQERMGVAGGSAFEALHMQINQHSTDHANFIRSRRWVAEHLLRNINGWGREQLRTIRTWAGGVDDGRTFSGIHYESGGQEQVTPDGLRAYYTEIFGQAPNRVDSPSDHPLSQAARRQGFVSRHDVARGGRAIDSPAIDGMTFEEYVQSWRDAGFNVVEDKNEYVDPSDHATGGHWHIALGPTRDVQIAVDDGEVPGFTFEEFMQLDPHVRRSVEVLARERLSEVIQGEQAARQEAAAAAREARSTAAILRGMADIESATQQATTGQAYTRDAQRVLELNFDAALQEMNEGRPVTFWQSQGPEFFANENVRNEVNHWISTNNYLPDRVVSWVANAMRRDEDFMAAAQVIIGMEDALMPDGTRIGDLLVRQFDPQTRALWDTLRPAIEGGANEAMALEIVEASRTGRGSTHAANVDDYERIGRETTPDFTNYETVRNTAIADALNVTEGPTFRLDPYVEGLFNSFFSASMNLDNNPRRAFSNALRSVTSLYRADIMFQGGVGPRVLAEEYSRPTVMRAISTATYPAGHPNAGRRLVPPASTDPRMRGPGGSEPVSPHGLGRNIFIRPVGTSNRGALDGRWEILVYRPVPRGTQASDSDMIERIPIDNIRELLEGANREETQIFDEGQTPSELMRRARQWRRTEDDRRDNPAPMGHDPFISPVTDRQRERVLGRIKPPKVWQDSSPAGRDN